MTLLQTVIAFVVALGTLIAIHEFGHYIVAKWCGVKVLRYCIGFGKPIFSRRLGKDQTEWALAAFPFGGYVKFLDEREGKVSPAEAHRAFNRQPVWKRFAIVVAGPVANFILAIALYYGLFIHGIDEPKAIVAVPPVATLAAGTGFQDGDEVITLNGESIKSWTDLRWRVLQLAVARGTANLEVVNANGQRRALVLNLSSMSAADAEGDFMRKIGLSLHRPSPSIGRVIPGGAAERAGFRAGDRIVSVAGSRAASGDQVIKAIRASAEKPLKFEVERDGALLQLTATPEAKVDEATKEKIGRINAEIGAKVPMTNVSYGFLGSLPQAVEKTWDMSIFSLKMLGKMVTGEVSWKNLSGPVTIADYAGQSARMGAYYYLNFLALISISLGVLNLLPIPMLDGGHLLYYVVEILRKKPVSERVMEIGQQFGMGVLFVLMAFALYNDIQRLISG